MLIFIACELAGPCHREFFPIYLHVSVKLQAHHNIWLYQQAMFLTVANFETTFLLPLMGDTALGNDQIGWCQTSSS